MPPEPSRSSGVTRRAAAAAAGRTGRVRDLRKRRRSRSVFAEPQGVRARRRGPTQRRRLRHHRHGRPPNAPRGVCLRVLPRRRPAPRSFLFTDAEAAADRAGRASSRVFALREEWGSRAVRAEPQGFRSRWWRHHPAVSGRRQEKRPARSGRTRTRPASGARLVNTGPRPPMRANCRPCPHRRCRPPPPGGPSPRSCVAGLYLHHPSQSCAAVRGRGANTGDTSGGQGRECDTGPRPGLSPGRL